MNPFIEKLKTGNQKKLHQIDLCDGVSVFVKHFSIAEFNVIKETLNPQDAVNETEDQSMNRLLKLFTTHALDKEGQHLFVDATDEEIADLMGVLSITQLRTFLTRIVESQGGKSQDSFPGQPT